MSESSGEIGEISLSTEQDKEKLPKGVINIFREGVYEHMTSMKHCEEIVREGLIAGKFGARIGKKNWEKVWHGIRERDSTLVSLGHTSYFAYNPEYREGKFRLTVLAHPTGKVYKLGFRKLVLMGADENTTSEIRVRDRLAPREFLGFCLSRNPLYFRLDLRRLVRAQAGLERKLPIYDRRGNLLWPEKIPFAKIRSLDSREPVTNPFTV